MHTRETLLAQLATGFILEHGLCAKLTPAKPTVFYGPSNDNTLNDKYISVTPRDFAVLDERLPECITHLLKERRLQGFNTRLMRSEHIDWMLAYWKKTALILPSAAFKEYAQVTNVRFSVDHAVYELEGLTTGTKLALTEYVKNITDTGIEYAGYTNPRSYILEPSWLDKNILEWKNKIDVGTALQLTPHALAEFFFAEYHKSQQARAPLFRSTGAGSSTGLGSELSPGLPTVSASTLSSLPDTLA